MDLSGIVFYTIFLLRPPVVYSRIKWLPLVVPVPEDSIHLAPRDEARQVGHAPGQVRHAAPGSCSSCTSSPFWIMSRY